MTTAVAKKKPAASTAVAVVDYEAELARMQEKLGAPSGNKIKVTQAKSFELTDGSEVESLDLVIVDFISRNEYYEGAYNPKEITPPVCVAIHPIPTEMAPAAESPDKQCETCAACPMNQFGSKGAGKACKNTRLLAVLPPDATADTPIQLLSVAPTAIKGFDRFISHLATAHKKLPAMVVVTVGFSPSVDHSQLVFSDPAPLEKDVAAMMLSRREEAMKLLTVVPDMTVVEKQTKAPARRPAGRGR